MNTSRLVYCTDGGCVKITEEHPYTSQKPGPQRPADGVVRTFRMLGVKKTRPSFRVLQGHESLAAASLLHGGDGLVPGMSNFVPALFVSLFEAARAGDVARSTHLQGQIEDLGTLHGHGHWLPALKAACAALGIGNGLPSPPLAPVTAEERRAIEDILARHNCSA